MPGTAQVPGMAGHQLSGVPGQGAGTKLAAELVLPWFWLPAHSPQYFFPSRSLMPLKD